MEKKFVAMKAFLVNPQGKILLLRHATAPHRQNSEGKWDLPGGRMDHGEHPLDCLRREVKEETGLEINTTAARIFHVDLWAVANDFEDNPIVGSFFSVLVGDVSITLSNEHNELCWYDPRQEIPENASSIVQRAIETYRKSEGIVQSSPSLLRRGPGGGQWEGFGLIQLFTGNGKGKTTASLGEALRAKAVGKKVGIVFFDKGGETHYSERRMLDRLEIPYVATGRDRIDPVSGRFDFSIQEIDKSEAARGLTEVRKFFDEQYDLVILDEINSTTALGMIHEQDVLTLLNQKPSHTEVVLTGRNAPESFIQKAHLMTEMRLHKHYFYSGVAAREGLDY